METKCTGKCESREASGKYRQVAVNSEGGEPFLRRGVEMNQLTKGSCTTYAKGDEGGAAVSVAQ